MVSGPGASPLAMETALVTWVVDGDTLELEDGRRVRVLGVDAPETGHGDAGPEPLSAAATERTRGLVAGRRVRLEVDTTDRDRYGRLLRHVWVGGRLLAEVLVREGLGRAYVIPPDDRYTEDLAAAERAARADGLGLWSLPGPTPLAVFRRPGDGTPVGVAFASPVPGTVAPASPGAGEANAGELDLHAACGQRVAGTVTAGEAARAVGQVVAAEFRVVRTKDTGKVTFLNSAEAYEGHFYVAVFPDDYPDFPAPPAEYFDGACVVVQGRVKMYKGSPEVVLKSADDIVRVGR